MTSKESVDPPHIPVSLLWQYTKDTIGLVDTEIDHLSACEQCIGLLDLCRACATLEQFEDIMESQSGTDGADGLKH